MNDLIKRADAIKAVKKMSDNYTGKGKKEYHPHIDFVVDELKYLPSADVVEVVRCRECRWYGRRNKARFYRGADCIRLGGMTTVNADDFCSYGERKEQTMSDRICKNCKWYMEEPIDHGYVCVNADSPYCAELWCREDDTCDEWEGRSDEHDK